MDISILGAGSWASSLAGVLIDNQHNVLLWHYKKKNKKNLNITNNIKDIEKTNVIFIALPSHAISNVLEKLSLKPEVLIVICSKGFDPTSSTSRMGIHCSHYHGRGKWATRYDLDNCTALCYGCHRFLGGRPLEHTEFMIKRLGKKKFKELNTRSNIIKKKRDFINKEFRKELKLMLENE